MATATETITVPCSNDLNSVTPRLTVGDVYDGADASRLSTTAGIELEQRRLSQLSAAGATTAIVADEETTAVTRQAALKLLSAGFSFFYAGINDGSLGTLIPYFRQTYNISLGSVTIIYAATFSGWCLAGLTNTLLLSHLPIGAILTLGALLQLLAHSLRFWTPPFPLFCVAFLLAALGIAYQDSHSNSFVTSVKGAHRWLGFIHAMYAVGLLTAPFIANSIAAAGQPSRWNLFYLAPLGLGIVNLLLVVVAFRDSLRRVQRIEIEAVSRTRKRRDVFKESWAIVKLPGVWQLSLFFFFYLGASFSVGGWLVEYLVTVRHGEVTKMGFVPAALSGGIVLGRLLLPEPTHRLGERRMVAIYCVLWLALQLTFWLVRSVTADIVAVTSMGICSGPFFATGISVGSKLFSRSSKPAALGFIFIAAQAGGALFPTLTGLIATHAGVGVLQPMVVGLIAACLASWLIIPKHDGHVN